MHYNLQHHHYAIKAAKTAPMARPSKRQLAGRSNQIKKSRIELRESVKLRPRLQACCRVKLPDRPAKAMKRATLKFPMVIK